jgi:hypothetical protein
MPTFIIGVFGMPTKMPLVFFAQTGVFQKWAFLIGVFVNSPYNISIEGPLFLFKLAVAVAVLPSANGWVGPGRGGHDFPTSGAPVDVIYKLDRHRKNEGIYFMTVH